MKSKKELINRGREIAANLLKNDHRQGYRYETINELCDALEEHEPKPKSTIRKGEVYAYRFTGHQDWLHIKTQRKRKVGVEGVNERRQLTLDEMPKWVSELVKEHGMPVKARTKHKILHFEEHGIPE